MNPDPQGAVGGGPWDTRWIRSILPHRFPFLLLDEVLAIEPGRRIVAAKGFTVDEPFFQGHFPGRPVVPGVLLVEGLAQAGAILLLSGKGRRPGQLLLSTIRRARFRRPVVPGDRVVFEVEVQTARPTYTRFLGRALVDGEIAAEAVCSATLAARSG